MSLPHLISKVYLSNSSSHLCSILRNLDGLLEIAPPHVFRVVLGRALDLARQLLQRLPLGLGDQQSREDAREHEHAIDLHDVVEPGRVARAGLRAAGAQRADQDLGDDCADFAARGGEAVGRGPVARGVALAGYDEGCRIGTEVEEELREDVEGEEGFAGQDVVGEADCDEDCGEDDEADELDGFAADCVYRCDGYLDALRLAYAHCDNL